MPCLEKVHVIFYDKLLSHPWLKDFFKGVPRWHLESQQSDFMSGLFGGPLIYGGRAPQGAHTHMFITEEIFLIRHELLAQSLTEANIKNVSLVGVGESEVFSLAGYSVEFVSREIVA